MSTPWSLEQTAAMYNMPLNDESEETTAGTMTLNNSSNSRNGWAGSFRRVKNVLRMPASASSKPRRRRSKGSFMSSSSSSSLADSIISSSSEFGLDNSNNYTCSSRSIGSNISGFSDITGMSDEYEESMSMSTGNISFEYEQASLLSSSTLIHSIDPEEEYRQAIQMAAKLRAESKIRAKRQQEKTEKNYQKMRNELLQLRDQQAALVKASGRRKPERERCAARMEALESECHTRRQQNRVLLQRKNDLEIQKMKIQRLTDRIQASIVDHGVLQTLQSLQIQKERIQRGRDGYLRTLEGIRLQSEMMSQRLRTLPSSCLEEETPALLLVQKEETEGRIAKVREQVKQMKNLVHKIRLRLVKQEQLGALDKEHHVPTSSSIIGKDILIMEGCDEREAISFADESSKTLP